MLESMAESSTESTVVALNGIQIENHSKCRCDAFAQTKNKCWVCHPGHALARPHNDDHMARPEGGKKLEIARENLV